MLIRFIFRSKEILNLRDFQITVAVLFVNVSYWYLTADRTKNISLAKQDLFHNSKLLHLLRVITHIPHVVTYY